MRAGYAGHRRAHMVPATAGSIGADERLGGQVPCVGTSARAGPPLPQSPAEPARPQARRVKWATSRPTQLFAGVCASEPAGRHKSLLERRRAPRWMARMSGAGSARPLRAGKSRTPVCPEGLRPGLAQPRAHDRLGALAEWANAGFSAHSPGTGTHGNLTEAEAPGKRPNRGLIFGVRAVPQPPAVERPDRLFRALCWVLMQANLSEN